MKFLVEENGQTQELDLTVLNVREGDTVIVKIPENTSVEYVKQISEQLKLLFKNNDTAIIPSNMEIGIVRSEE